MDSGEDTVELCGDSNKHNTTKAYNAVVCTQRLLCVSNAQLATSSFESTFEPLKMCDSKKKSVISLSPNQIHEIFFHLNELCSQVDGDFFYKMTLNGSICSFVLLDTYTIYLISVDLFHSILHVVLLFH